MSLKGRAIRLKANMSTEEMLTQLKENEEDWRKEGYSKDEILAAQESKIRPLIYGYYWKRYPDAQQRAEEAWNQYAGFDIKGKGKAIAPILNWDAKHEKPPKDLMKQFEEYL